MLGKINNLNTEEKILVEHLGRKFLEGSSYVCLLNPFIVHCPGSSWDRVNFLPRSWYSAVFWI